MKQLCTIKEAAEKVGLEYRQLLNACNEGLVPIYQLRKSRRMVCVHEIIGIMQRQGGTNV